MNHDFSTVPFPLRAALTLSNNSRLAAAINLHPIYKPLKCRSPFLLAASARRTVGGTLPPPQRASDRKREKEEERERERASKTEKGQPSVIWRGAVC